MKDKNRAATVRERIFSARKPLPNGIRRAQSSRRGSFSTRFGHDTSHWLLLAVCLAVYTGCSRTASQPRTTPPNATQPTSVDDRPVGRKSVADTLLFHDEHTGLKIRYPTSFQVVADADYVLKIVPNDGASRSNAPFGTSDDRWISLDIPQLPVHIPGMIPIGAVESGYLDDLRKQFGTLNIQELPPPVIAGSRVRRVRVSWSEGQTRITQSAVLWVHGDAVFILRAHYSAESDGTMDSALDAIIRSIQYASPAQANH